MPVQRIRFTEDTGGIFEDKQHKGRTEYFTVKDSGNTDQRHASGRPRHARSEDSVIDRCG